MSEKRSPGFYVLAVFFVQQGNGFDFGTDDFGIASRQNIQIKTGHTAPVQQHTAFIIHNRTSQCAAYTHQLFNHLPKIHHNAFASLFCRHPCVLYKTCAHAGGHALQKDGAIVPIFTFFDQF